METPQIAIASRTGSILALSLLLVSCQSAEDKRFKSHLDAVLTLEDPSFIGSPLGMYVDIENYNSEQITQKVTDTFNAKYTFESAKQKALDFCTLVKADPDYYIEELLPPEARERRRDLIHQVTYPVKEDKKQLLDETIDEYVDASIDTYGKLTYCPTQDIPN